MAQRNNPREQKEYQGRSPYLSRRDGVVRGKVLQTKTKGLEENQE